jgi:hypothetical protein
MGNHDEDGANDDHRVFLLGVYFTIRTGIEHHVEISAFHRLFLAGMVPLPSERRGCIADA